MSLPIALQVYSVRDQAQADLRGVLKEVAAWGFDGVEFAGLYGHEPERVRAWLDEFGLRCAGAHVGVAEFEGAKLGATLDAYEALGCPYVIVPWLPEEKRNSVEAAKQTAAWFTQLAGKVEPRGFFTGFHAHAQDMRELTPGGGVATSAYYLMANATPDSFMMQYDTGNGMEGGADPVAPINDFPGRTVSLHLKSFVNGPGGGHGVAEVGADDVPWPEVLGAARSVGGTQWLVIEQEGHATLDPMAAAKASFDGIQKFL